MASIALALPVTLEDRLAEEATRHGHEVIARCASAQELASAVSAHRPSIVIASAEPRYLTERVLAISDDCGARIVALVGSDAARRQAAALGLYETLDASATWPEIEALFGRAPSFTIAADTGAAPKPGRGTVIAVWGPAGSPGRTTVAITVAAEIAALGHSVALADLDTHGASVAPALGMLDEAPGFAAACRLAATDSLTRDELERISQRYESTTGSFWVLTGIGRPSRWPELSAERVATSIARCREWVEFTVLDVGSSLENDEEISSDLFAPRRNAATVTGVHSADLILAVGSADPVGLARFLRSHVDVLEAASTHNITVVMNRVRASAIGMNPHGQVTQTLSRFGGIESPVLVPFDLAALDGALLSGRTLTESAPRSPARVAIRDLVASRLAPQPAIDRMPRRGLSAASLFGRTPVRR
jgi:MinD-like ATPase involved in chromosome partitioning or flagellar assembly